MSKLEYYPKWNRVPRRIEYLYLHVLPFRLFFNSSTYIVVAYSKALRDRSCSPQARGQRKVSWREFVRTCEKIKFGPKPKRAAAWGALDDDRSGCRRRGGKECDRWIRQSQLQRFDNGATADPIFAPGLRSTHGWTARHTDGSSWVSAVARNAETASTAVRCTMTFL